MGLKLGRAFRDLGAKTGRETIRALPMAVADLVQEVFELESVRGPLCTRAILYTAMGAWATGTAQVLLNDSAGTDGGAAGTAVFAAGGTDALISPFVLACFGALRALSVRNDAPAEASRPFDKDRDGFVLGEGAGILVLEELEHARSRSCHIYAELAGYGTAADAYHATASSADGHARTMSLALADAGVAPDEVDYINAHGTSTQHNDLNETHAIKEVFGSHAYRLSVSSTTVSSAPNDW